MEKLKVKKDNKFGVVNEDNKILVPLEYDDIGAIMANGLVKVKLGKWGVVNFENKVIVPLKYEKWQISLMGDFIRIEDSINYCKKFGAYNKNGKLILDIEADEISSYNDSLICYKNNKLYVYDINGKEDDELKDKYIKMKVKNDFVKSYYKSLKNEDNKYGFQFIVSIEDVTNIDTLFPYVSDYPIVEINEYRFYAKVKNDNKFGIINRNGEIIVPLEYDDIEFIFENSISVAKDGKYGMINYQSGKIVIPLEYDNLEWSIFSN